MTTHDSSKHKSCCDVSAMQVSHDIVAGSSASVSATLVSFSYVLLEALRLRFCSSKWFQFPHSTTCCAIIFFFISAMPHADHNCFSEFSQTHPGSHSWLCAKLRISQPTVGNQTIPPRKSMSLEEKQACWLQSSSPSAESHPALCFSLKDSRQVSS